MFIIFSDIYFSIVLLKDIFLNVKSVILVVIKMEGVDPVDLFLREKPVKALVALADKSRVWYARMLAKETDTTYAHIVKILDAFAELGLVVFEKEGRVKIVRLTEQGEELAHEFGAVLRRLARLEKTF